jgi:hypothetical protein
MGSGLIGDESGIRNRVESLLIFLGVRVVALDVGANFLNPVVDVLLSLPDVLLGRVTKGQDKREVEELIIN